MLACLAGCSKEGGGVEGVWYSSTSDGMLFLELRSGGNGVVYFEGCSSASAFWSVDGKAIKIIGGTFSKSLVMYDLGEGTIVGSDIMRIEATIDFKRKKTLTFTKQ